MSQKEHDLQDKIKLAVSQQTVYIPFRLNSGLAWGGNKIIDIPGIGRVLTSPRRIALMPNGTPDLMCLGPAGDTVFIEVKTKQGRLSLEQRRFHAMLKRNGFRVCVARSAEEAVDFLNRNRET